MSIYSLSTSWNSSPGKDASTMIGEIRSAGFDSVELGFSLKEDVVRGVRDLVAGSIVKVSSLHNMCPLPDQMSQENPSPDYYSLSSQSDRERNMAISIAKHTMDWAMRLGAKAMVLHAGRVEIKDMSRDLARVIESGGDHASLRKEMVRERAGLSSIYLDRLMRSLDELVSHSHATGIKIGLENRFYYREMPILEEMKDIFRTFGPGKLYYWHDVGHAEVLERLGLGSHDQLLRELSGRLLGIHLHDIINVMDDHRAPGSGTFDFRRLVPYVRQDTIRVIEAHRPATVDEVWKSLSWLKEILG